MVVCVSFMIRKHLLCSTSYFSSVGSEMFVILHCFASLSVISKPSKRSFVTVFTVLINSGVSPFSVIVSNPFL